MLEYAKYFCLRIWPSILQNAYLGSEIYGNSKVTLLADDGCIVACQILSYTRVNALFFPGALCKDTHVAKSDQYIKQRDSKHGNKGTPS